MRSLITTRARPDTCRRCRAAVLRGVSEGTPAMVDAEPIGRETEWKILLNGRRTYIRDFWHGQLWERHNWRIRGRLGYGNAIYAQHMCTKPHEQLRLALDSVP